MPTALILFGHGSRDSQWAEPLRAVARLVAMQSDAPARIELAFLEFMNPTLPEAMANAVGEGATQVRLAPLFLGVGGHLRRDVAALVDVARITHPGVTIEVLPPMGESADVLAAIAAWTRS